uniref:Golgi membrane protein 1 n=1 Tax=Balaenoptera musculus TaxID=9771 RepID=A0A8C0CSU1_BALMU
MMGLGNGRRSMKSPPLVLAALVACIIVLGFNYWIASSRSVDLQTRIVELEGRVRRAAAERGAVEMKKNEFQGELEKQREQLDKIQSSHNFQMESVNKLYQDEKFLDVPGCRCTAHCCSPESAIHPDVGHRCVSGSSVLRPTCSDSPSDVT